jgi:hypothetical protein
LDWHHWSVERNQTVTAKQFDKIYPNLCLKQPIILTWVKNKKKWRDEWEIGGGSRSAKRTKQTKHLEVNDMLELWTLKTIGDGIHLTGEVLRQKWRHFADMANIPLDERLHLSDGWLASFKKQCGLKEFKFHGEAASAKPDDVEKECARVRELITNLKYPLRNIFNMDEMGHFYA